MASLVESCDSASAIFCAADTMLFATLVADVSRSSNAAMKSSIDSPARVERVGTSFHLVEEVAERASIFAMPSGVVRSNCFRKSPSAPPSAE
jgi:hypothetical protein